MDHKLRQVQPHSATTLQLHRVRLRSPTGSRFPPPVQVDKNSTTSASLPVAAGGPSCPMGQLDRTANLMPGHDSSGPAAAPTYPVSCQSLLEGQRMPHRPHSCDRLLQRHAPVVAMPRERDVRSASPPSRPNCFHPYRRESGRLWQHHGQSSIVRTVGRQRPTSSHKLSRTSECLQSSPAFRAPCYAPISAYPHRQYHCRCLSAETIRDSLTHPTQSDSGHSHMVLRQGRHSSVPPHSRRPQHFGGQPFPPVQTGHHGMVASPLYHGRDLQYLGTAHHRPVCHSAQSPAPPVLLPSPGPPISGPGRSHTGLERPDRVRLPSLCPDHASAPQGSKQCLHSVSCGTQVAPDDLVSGPSEPAGRLSPADPSVPQVAQATQDSPQLPQSPPYSTLTRLQSVEQHLRSEGFSEQSAARIARKTRPTSNDLYERYWHRYVIWCEEHHIDPFQASVPQLTDFFNVLFDSGNYKPHTIEGFKACICTTLSLALDKQLSHNARLSALMSNFKQSAPSSMFEVPKWNLTLVLNMLINKPFEPLVDCSLKLLTYKTVFLVALASAGRCSELHALSFEHLTYNEDRSCFWLQPHPEFLAKTQPSRDPKFRKVFKIPALADFAGPDLPDRFLCPVRALRLYLAKTTKLRKQRKSLFISFSPSHTGDITKNTIAGWLRRTIRMAHTSATADDISLARATPHEVRALSASVAFDRNISLDNIMSACSWRSHNTFTSFYLRDLARQGHDSLSLPPLVVAQTTTHP